MKIVYLLHLLFVWVNCQKRPTRQVSGEIIPIISYVNQKYGENSYYYSFETGNGISVEEEGALVRGGIQTAEGSYSYTAPDGRVISVDWYADETGFHAEGDHIPKTIQIDDQPRGFPGAPTAPVYPIK